MTRSLPTEFTEYTRSLMGEALYEQLLKGITTDDFPCSIRLNPYKCPEAIYIPSAIADIPWCPSTGRYLRQRPNFTFDPLLHAGLYYVQEASSMFVDLVVRQLINQPITMLDLCAAPGGKSTTLRAALPEGSLLFSNEPIRTRAQILNENLLKFGHPDMVVTNNYASDYAKTRLQFDAILADVPCSGEGMFRKDEGAIGEWSPQNVENCWKLQRSIISDIWPCLKPGGLLIYSTCTFNAHEDEENVEWIAQELGASFVSLNIRSEWNITGNLLGKDFPVYRFLPGKTQGEGIFLAVLRKDGRNEEKVTKTNHRNKDKKAQRDKREKKLAQTAMPSPTDWLHCQEGAFSITTIGENFYAIPNRWKDKLEEAAQKLKLMNAGIKMGTIKGRDFVPSQGLALSTLLYKEHFTIIELSYEEAIAYLRHEAVTLPEGTPRGYTLMSYKGCILGWEKNIGNRANNLYPQEWKIKSTHIPEGEKEVLTW